MDKGKRDLTKIAREIRKKLLKIHHNSKASHIGSGLSIVEILVALYFNTTDITKENIDSRNRDSVILSKGHAAAALYAVLKEKNILTEKELLNYYKDGQYLSGHPSVGIRGIEVSSGSLGHGFPMGVGIALSNKLDKKPHHTYVILGDGECNEGVIFESAIISARLKLDNLTVIIDNNGLQGYDCTKDINPIEKIYDIWKSIGWNVVRVDGHDFCELAAALDKNNLVKDKPTAIIADTIKGKGVSFMENKLEWHYKSPNEEELNKALKELEKQK